MDGEPPGGGLAEPPAARLRQLRAQRGLSQEQLAHLLGVSFATVNRWETGRTRMSARARQALADFEARDGFAGRAAGPALAQALSAGPVVAAPPAPAPPSPPAPPSAASGPMAAAPPAPASQASGPTAAAPVSSPPAPAGPTLPVAQSSFIGRDRELGELVDLLESSRLLTLIGPGGAGKTRLAVEALSRSAAAVPVTFISLEAVRQPGSLSTVLAAGLRVPDQAGVALAESVAAALAEVPRLIVLDGAEHLRDAVAVLAGQLLGAAPGVRIVVTSRVVLGAPGEVCWTVPPLDCPSAAAGVADIAGSDAVQLFVARARERLPSFSVGDVPPHAIGELCRRLDGLPLAIELIAGWVGALSVREILQQRAVLLDQDAPGAAGSRGRRLVDVVRASYGLLQPEEQRLLAMLSVFAGSFTVADAQGVSAAGPAVAHLIRGLVDSSWLVVTRGSEHNRFSMLDTMRTFAAARLAESGSGPAVRQRHAEHFAALAQGSETGLAGRDAAEWMARLASSTADLDQALQWLEDDGDLRLGLDMGAALWRWWLLRGRLSYGRAWLGRLLAQAGQRRDESAGRALCSAALLAAENGDYGEAVRQARLALRILEPLGVPDRTATAATVLGSAYRYLGDLAAARRSFATAMELRAGLGDRRALSAALNNMALLEVDDGDLARGRELFEQALAIKRRLGERRSLAIGLANLGDLLTRLSQWEAAARALAEAAALAADLGNPQLIGTVQCNLGNVATHQQEWAEAAGHYAAAVAAYQEAGHGHDAVEALTGLGRACHRLGRPDEGAGHLRAAEALAVELGNPQRLAEARAALAETTGDTAGWLPGGLTARQAEVLRLLAAGMSNKQIAAELYLSPATVERHLATIYRKLGLAGRVEAARYALAHGLAAAMS